MRQHRFKSLNPDGFHQLAYTEWGDPANENTLICSHGLTLNGRYFDWFSKAAQDHFRVICPDTVGRGKSDWVDPKHYWFDTYVNDAVALLAHARAQKVDWIGTSMGGLIGMMIATKKGHPIRRLILNDVGPAISHESLQFIGNYIGQDERFNTHDEVEAHLKKLYPLFGNLSAEQWRHLARIGSKDTPDGNMRLAYDPRIRETFRRAEGDFQIWDVWEKLDIPILILRGSASGILTQDTLEEMLRRNPNAQAHVFEGIGHAPPLMTGDQIDVVIDFLSHN